METGRVNKHRAINSCDYGGEYLLHGRNRQIDKPIDLTNGNSSDGREAINQDFSRDQESPPSNDQYYQRNKERYQDMLASNNAAYFHNFDNQGDVMRAAKSLFSKRTRTLYHWMYPNTPKFQLKSAISLAWDTMGPQEKQFYISQVLGKFGYSQNSLMINPQLGCLAPIPLVNQDHPDLSNVETSNAVSNLLQEGRGTWPVIPSAPQSIIRKRGRPRGSKTGSERQPKPKKIYKHSKTAMDDDFTDDPELRKELEQFQWALHLADK